MNEVYILMRGDELRGVYSSYQRAIHSLMINCSGGIKEFSYQFGVDFFTDMNNKTWSIESKELDEM